MDSGGCFSGLEDFSLKDSCFYIHRSLGQFFHVKISIVLTTYSR